MERHDIAGHLKLFKELYQKEKKTKRAEKSSAKWNSTTKNRWNTCLVDEFSYALNETRSCRKSGCIGRWREAGKHPGSPKKAEQNLETLLRLFYMLLKIQRNIKNALVDWHESVQTGLCAQMRLTIPGYAGSLFLAE